MDYKFKEIKRALLIFGFMAFLSGIIYPLAITGLSQALFPAQANGSMITIDGEIVGSKLIGQAFTSPQYFYGRPSAVDYDASDSGASNWGPMNEDLLHRVQSSIDEIRLKEGLSLDVKIPSDLVFASGSGLDRYIRVESAELQVSRVARERGVSEVVITDLIKEHEEVPFPWTGDPVVNVLKLNIALDNFSKLTQ